MAENASSETNGAKSPAVNGAAGTTAPTSTAPEKLSGADKKKQQKAEKAARRAKAKETQAAPSASSTNMPSPANNGAQTNNQKDASKQPKNQQQQQQQPQHKRSGSVGSASQQKQLPLRSRPSVVAAKDQPPKKSQISFVSHLHDQPHRRSLEGTPKDVHPAVSAFALQQSNYIICGSHARCVAMLLALKPVISSYTTPHGNSLPRHLVSHHLSPQLTHLKSSRPFSISQANAIRWLKNLIANIDPSLAEDEAKSYVTTSIDTFIRDKFTIADQVIAETASERISDNDVVVTFGKSAVVQSTLMHAAKQGTKFRVVVIDSRPLLEGKHLARYLSPHIEVSYAFVSGLSRALQDATKCILGAHAIYANGRLQSRAGTALVAMAAKARKVPVIVCTESLKLTDRIAIDSIVGNELAPEEELLDPDFEQSVDSKSEPTDPKAEPSKQKGASKESQGKGGKAQEGASDGPSAAGVEPQRGAFYTKWKETVNLQILNAMFDITPAENINEIITELGSFPPSMVPVVHKLSAGS